MVVENDEELCPTCHGDHIRMAHPGLEEIDFCEDLYHDINVDQIITKYDAFKLARLHGMYKGVKNAQED
jgi:hypothetical protein